MIITLNEEQNIQPCIQSLQRVADEILVLDSGSQDRTKEIASQLGAKVHEVKWRGYAQTKNLGASLTEFSHILSIDADEEISPELANSVVAAKEAGLKSAYSFDRRNFYLGKWIRFAGWYPDKKIRLYPVDEASWQGDYVHEELVVNSDVSVQDLDGAFNHYSITSIEQHKATIEKYAGLAARREFESGKSISSLKAISRAIFTFIKIYILKLGFLEGRRGWLIARYSAWSKWRRYQLLKSLKSTK